MGSLTGTFLTPGPTHRTRDTHAAKDGSNPFFPNPCFLLPVLGSSVPPNPVFPPASLERRLIPLPLAPSARSLVLSPVRRARVSACHPHARTRRNSRSARRHRWPKEGPCPDENSTSCSWALEMSQCSSPDVNGTPGSPACADDVSRRSHSRRKATVAPSWEIGAWFRCPSPRGPSACGGAEGRLVSEGPTQPISSPHPPLRAPLLTGCADTSTLRGRDRPLGVKTPESLAGTGVDKQQGGRAHAPRPERPCQGAQIQPCLTFTWSASSLAGTGG